MARLGFQGAASKSTFYEYIKSLRKLGTPFERGKIGYGRKAKANYTYCHLMELALALTLRVYHVVPDLILMEIVRHRRGLNRLYRRAYAERCTGLGAALTIKTGSGLIHIRGAFLDLNINFSGGKLASFGPPSCCRHLKPSRCSWSATWPHGLCCRSICRCFRRGLYRQHSLLRRSTPVRATLEKIEPPRERNCDRGSVDPAWSRRTRRAPAVSRPRRCPSVRI